MAKTLSEQLEALKKKLTDLDPSLIKDKGILEAFKNIEGAAKNTERAISSLGDGLATFSKMSIASSTTLSDMVSVLASADNSLNSFGATLNNLSRLIPGLSDATGQFTETLNYVSRTILSVVSIANEMAEAYDGMDQGTRDLTKEQYKFAASIGEGFDQALKFKDAYNDIIIANSKLGQDGFFIDPDELKESVKYLQGAGFSIEDLAAKSEFAGGKLNKAQAMTMQAKAMGMDVSDYSKKMADMVRKSGLSMEDSMKLMASSQDIARDTGLRVDEVTQALDGATSGFQRMGMTIDFGRPILKGFADSLKDVGLGVAQASDLTATFTQSLGKIASDPALAYFTSTAGGMKLPGGQGGFLNSSIQMRSMMMDQTPGGQADFAKQMTESMKNILESKSGGGIVTLKEAAEGGAETQGRFAKQEMLLSSLYGISNVADQDRIMELFSKLNEATVSGDSEMINKINEQISDAANGNDATMDIQKKISIAMDASVLLLQQQLSIAKANFIKGGGEQSFLDGINTSLSKVQGVLEPGANEDEKLKRLAAAQNLVNSSAADASSAGGKAAVTPPPSVSGTPPGGAASPPGVTVPGAPMGLNLTVNVNNNVPGASVEIGALAASPGTPKP